MRSVNVKNKVVQAHTNFSREVDTLTRVFFLWKALRSFIKKDQNIFNVLDQNALTWNTILHSVQCTLFITLGRLFEGEEGISTDKFLRICIDNIDEFSKNPLRNRKITQSGGKQEWLELYMHNTYKPRIKDFDKLIYELGKRKALYMKTYKPIRQKIMAHLDISTIDNIDSLFGGAKISEIQDFLLVMYQIEKVVFHLLFNGKLYPIDNFILEEENPVFKDMESLLTRI